MGNFLNELVNRWKASTPVFFKKIIIIGVALSGCGASLVGIPGIPARLAAIGNVLIWVGSAAATVAKFAVTTSTSDFESK